MSADSDPVFENYKRVKGHSKGADSKQAIYGHLALYGGEGGKGGQRGFDSQNRDGHGTEQCIG